MKLDEVVKLDLIDSSMLTMMNLPVLSGNAQINTSGSSDFS